MQELGRPRPRVADLIESLPSSKGSWWLHEGLADEGVKDATRPCHVARAGGRAPRGRWPPEEGCGTWSRNSIGQESRRSARV